MGAVNDVKSDWASVVSDVPQGTVLDLLLIYLHIHVYDITANIRVLNKVICWCLCLLS